ncbi:hypothetical protein [Anaerotignum sp.]|uniref:hypothetical protein n=1 Tax=Anaerotignum sp. TaxID=2039241 RepID=UPI0027153D40|nr:hypothetical protein [Anaerotignum sp.]
MAVELKKIVEHFGCYSFSKGGVYRYKITVESKEMQKIDFDSWQRMTGFVVESVVIAAFFKNRLK